MFHADSASTCANGTTTVCAGMKRLQLLATDEVNARRLRAIVAMKTRSVQSSWDARKMDRLVPPSCHLNACRQR